MTLIQQSLADLRQTVASMDCLLPAIEESGCAISKSLENGHVLYACGNGGSACDALHLTEELTGRFRAERIPLPAVCLNSDVSLITCIGNDYGFDEIFARPVSAMVRTGDVVVGFSTSGNSENVRKALETARSKGAITIALLGKDGGAIREIAHHPLIIPSSDTARIQEMHTFILHVWLEMLERQEWLLSQPIA